MLEIYDFLCKLFLKLLSHFCFLMLLLFIFLHLLFIGYFFFGRQYFGIMLELIEFILDDIMKVYQSFTHLGADHTLIITFFNEYFIIHHKLECFPLAINSFLQIYLSLKYSLLPLISKFFLNVHPFIFFNFI